MEWEGTVSAGLLEAIRAQTKWTIWSFMNSKQHLYCDTTPLRKGPGELADLGSGVNEDEEWFGPGQDAVGVSYVSCVISSSSHPFVISRFFYVIHEYRFCSSAFTQKMNPNMAFFYVRMVRAIEVYDNIFYFNCSPKTFLKLERKCR
jgi:hypothetical protein